MGAKLGGYWRTRLFGSFLARKKEQRESNTKHIHSHSFGIDSRFIYHAPMSQGKLVLIIGPSGVGKSVILRALRTRHTDWVFPRSATTRERREKEGDDLYHFVSDDDFSSWLAEEKFLEWAQVHKSARYGTLLSEIIPAIEQGKVVVREVDVQGFESLKNHALFQPRGPYRLQTIFILPENEEQLIAHIEKRAPMAKEELERRRESMRKELGLAEKTDQQIVNAEGHLSEAISAVEAAILLSC